MDPTFYIIFQIPAKLFYVEVYNKDEEGNDMATSDPIPFSEGNEYISCTVEADIGAWIRVNMLIFWHCTKTGQHFGVFLLKDRGYLPDENFFTGLVLSFEEYSR